MSYRRFALAAIVVACSSCGPETTSFRTTDRGDPHRAGPPSAAYDIYVAGQLVAQAHVWSSGGYVSSGDKPMTHIGFEISNASAQPITFDADALELAVFDGDGEPLAPPRLAAITPRGSTLIAIPPGETGVLAAYFSLPVRPRGVDGMQVRWQLHAAGDDHRQITGFVRDDDAPVIERTPASASASAGR